MSFVHGIDARAHNLRNVSAAVDTKADRCHEVRRKVTVEEETEISPEMNFYGNGGREEVPALKVRYKVQNNDKFFLDPWYAAITVEQNDDAYDELALFDDIRQAKRSVFNEDDTLIFDKIADFKKMDFKYGENAKYVEGVRTGSKKYKKDTGLYIVERFTDLSGDNSISKLTAGLNNINILYPDKLYAGIRSEDEKLSFEKYKDELITYSKIDGYTFSPSQIRAMKQFFEKNITLLLGPPGTGKTDFIARSVITLCAFYQKNYKRPLSVLVTANSHAAINNILEKIAEKKGENVQSDTRFPLVIKLDKYDSERSDPAKGIEIYDKYFPYVYMENLGREAYDYNAVNTLPNLFSSHHKQELDTPFVIGATSSAMRSAVTKAKRYSQNGMNCVPVFDLIIIDEASQVRVGDALIGMDQFNGTGDTRYMIVGDENQLSPIIKGKYKVDENVCDIYGSIFRLYYDENRLKNDGETGYLCHLEENFRMNEILDRYPGKMIYDTDIRDGDGRHGYHAYRATEDDDSIAAQKISIDQNGLEHDEGVLFQDSREIVNKILDPEYPLILVKLSGGNASSKQETEISLVTCITQLLKKYMFKCDKTELGYYDTDEEFWGDSDHKGAYAIISPHHEHINRLKERISSELDMDINKLYIGTVDKLQGQEREAVVVSYGISNVEKAVSETEFIYSLNRLNVSLTRGKKKTICILTDALLDRPIELLDVDDEKIEAGIAFMCDFEKFMNEKEEDTELFFAEKEIDGINVEVRGKKVI